MMGHLRMGPQLAAGLTREPWKYITVGYVLNTGWNFCLKELTFKHLTFMK